MKKRELMLTPFSILPLALSLILILPTLGRALTPFEYYNSLVAGHGVGYRDGDFYQAQFNTPTGLCFSESGDKLFVADSTNQRIRVVDLLNNNDVETLAGTGVPGNTDGPFEKAAFFNPTRLAALSNDRLAVCEFGTNQVRILDLKTRTVSTIPGIPPAWDMVYDPKDESLYFSETESKSLGRLDLKSLKVSTVFSNDSRVPAPRALCLGQDKLYVADKTLPTVYELELKDGKNPGQKEASFKAVGQADHVLEMAYSDGSLYALRSGDIPLVRIGSPKSIPVSLATPWGFSIDNKNIGFDPFLIFQDNVPVGFITSPKENRKLYITSPFNHIARHSVISVKDYGFDSKALTFSSKNRTEDVTDFDYPAKKPIGTYRVLVVGDSRTQGAPRLVPGEKTADPGPGTLRTDTFPKQLEFFLNSDAALNGVKTHFEVLTLSRPDQALSSYAAEDVPPLVKKYNVDMVLALAGSTGYEDYFDRPLVSGVPSSKEDKSYAQKPLSEKVLSGVSKDLYDHCVNEGLLDGKHADLPSDWKLLMTGNDGIRKDLLEMTGQRLVLLSQKLPGIKLALLYIPFRPFPNDQASVFWKDLCSANSLPFLDITEPYEALKTSFYPTDQKEGGKYYTAYGNEFIARLLTHYLVENSLVPFTPAPQ